MSRETSAPTRARHVRAIVAYGLGPMLGLLSGPILARALGPEGRGQFAAILQPITVLGAVAALGVPAAVTYFVARGVDSRRTYRDGLRIMLIPAAVVFVGILAYSSVVAGSQGLPQSFLIAIWSTALILAVVEIRRGAFQGRQRWKVLDVERAANAVLRFTAIVLAALLGAGAAETFAVAHLAGVFIAALVLVVAPLTVTGAAGSSETRPRLSEMTKFSLWAAVGTITVVANNRIDQLLFPAAGSPVELGYYSVAVTVAEVPLVLGVLAARNALAQVSGGEKVTRTARSIAPYLVLVAVGCAVLAVIAGPLVRIVFGAAFEPSSYSLQILLGATVVGAINLVLIAVITGMGRPALSAVIPSSALVVTVALFVSRWGEVTSVFASLTAASSQLIACSVGIVLVWRFAR